MIPQSNRSLGPESNYHYSNKNGSQPSLSNAPLSGNPQYQSNYMRNYNTADDSNTATVIPEIKQEHINATTFQSTYQKNYNQL
jgi:hypothetical protein